ncbi:hypothetical protein PWG14_28080 [Chromobacterium amazonense]|uniref:hypothetical protein n=1 Tax=Chromobacterium amazonense TaxID=1382803 RepID=UPI00237DADE2|nr:hypothetical protein [Chromobacterium amazonense]MDE1716330.1 hypothetical protein [Chromobacterium amazonense]
MCKVFERLAWLKILICIGMMFFALHARAGTVDAYLTDVRNFNSYATHSQNAAYGFCNVFSCDPLKTFIVRAGDMSTVPEGRRYSYLMALSGEWRSERIYTHGSLVGAGSDVQVKIVSMGYSIESVSSAVDRSGLDLLANQIKVQCPSADTHYFEQNGKKGIGVWFGNGRKVGDTCRFEIYFPHGDLKLKDLVVAYEVSGSGLKTLPAGDYQASYSFDVSSKNYSLQSQNGDGDLTGHTTLNLRFNVHPEISVRAMQDIWLVNLSGRATRQVQLTLETNSPFSITISSCTNAGSECVMEHNSAGHRVPLQIQAYIPGFESGEDRQSKVLLGRNRPAIFFPRAVSRTHSGRVPGARLYFDVFPTHVATMLGGRYSSTVTIIFDTAL